MLRADRRVVVSHVGSLVRPPAMIPYLEKIRDKEPYDEAAFEKCLTDSVAEAVRLQAEAGINVVSDGEYGKSVNWAFYVHRRNNLYRNGRAAARHRQSQGGPSPGEGRDRILAGGGASECAAQCQKRALPR